MNIGIFGGSGTGFGDSIRTKKIIEFLLEKGYGVVNLNIEGNSKVNKTQLEQSSILQLPRSFLAKIPIFNHINFLLISKQLEKKISKAKIDVLQCETTIPAYIGSLVLKQKKIPLIFDMHGLSAEQALMEGKPHLMIQYIHKIQTETLNSSNHIFTVSDLHKKYLQSVVPAEKMTIIPNAGDIRSYYPKSDKDINVVYGGIFAYWENIRTYIQSTVYNENKKINFYLLGDGPLRGKLTNLIYRLDAPVKYIGKLSREQTLNFFDRCDIGILTSSKDIARKIASPIKFFDYLSSGLAVLAEDVGWWPKVIRKYGVGQTVGHNSPVQMYNCILNIATNNLRRKQMSHNARQLINSKYNWRKQLSKMIKVYDSLL